MVRDGDHDWTSISDSFQDHSDHSRQKVVVPDAGVPVDDWFSCQIQSSQQSRLDSPDALRLGMPLNGDLRGLPHYCDFNFTVIVSTHSSNDEDNWFLCQPFCTRAHHADVKVNGSVKYFEGFNGNIAHITQPGSGYAQATEADVRGTQFGGNAPCIIMPENIQGLTELTYPILIGVQIMNVGRQDQEFFVHGSFSGYLYRKDIDVFDPAR